MTKNTLVHFTEKYFISHHKRVRIIRLDAFLKADGFTFCSEIARPDPVIRLFKG